MKAMLERTIKNELSYKLEERYEGYKIPVISDAMFHTMINNESRKQYVCYLIALALDMDYKQVYDNIIFMKNKIDNEQNNQSKKQVDFVCDINGEIIGIEMNNNASIKALERNIFYATSLYGKDMTRGVSYNFKKIIQLNINNFTFEGCNEPVEEFVLKNKNGMPLTDKIKIVHVFLPIIRKRWYNQEEISKFEKLLLTFNETDEDLLEKVSLGDEIMREYIKDAIAASNEDDVIYMFDNELHQEKLRLSEIQEASEQKYQEGIEQGAKQKALETAKNFLKKGIDIETISECIGLSIEEINNL